ncbi:MAG TPA: methyltransferase [Chitinophagaceae bacterium]|nr:methyltransferase [Chitinophagaceae bacterium]
MEHTDQQHPDPSKIMQIGMGFWAAKALLAGVKFKLFTLLAGKKMSGAEIKKALKLQTTDRHVYDWLDVLVALGFLRREGIWDNAAYSNNSDTEIFLDKNKPSYIGGILEMGNNRLYRFWGDLEEGLLTGHPQNEAKHGSNMDFLNTVYQTEEKMQEFIDAMSGIQMGNFMTLCKKFDFSKYKTLADVGGADGWLSIQICLNHPNIKCTTYDLSPVESLAKKKIARFNLSDRIQTMSGDFLKDELPRAEIITMGNIIHGMGEEEKQKLIDKVYGVLPENGVFITIENIIDDDRKQNVFGLLMSLNMLIENGDAFDYTPSDFDRWTKKAGFKRMEIMPLAGPTSAAIAYK